MKAETVFILYFVAYCACIYKYNVEIKLKAFTCIYKLT